MQRDVQSWRDPADSHHVAATGRSTTRRRGWRIPPGHNRDWQGHLAARLGQLRGPRVFRRRVELRGNNAQAAAEELRLQVLFDDVTQLRQEQDDGQPSGHRRQDDPERNAGVETPHHRFTIR